VTLDDAQTDSRERVDSRLQHLEKRARILYGQRVDGVVRVTDVPLIPGGRAYLVEANANAALQAPIADYLQRHPLSMKCP